MKKIGIFLDHSVARFIDPDKGSIEREIKAELSGHERIPGESTAGGKTGPLTSSNNEYNRHQREQRSLAGFYKEIASALNGYQSVYLFGPTTAGEEFRNYLTKLNHLHFQIDLEKSDYMTDNQLVARVKQHFSLIKG